MTSKFAAVSTELVIGRKGAVAALAVIAGGRQIIRRGTS
jgi:hypothetical protein